MVMNMVYLKKTQETLFTMEACKYGEILPSFEVLYSEGKGEIMKNRTTNLTMLKTISKSEIQL